MARAIARPGVRAVARAGHPAAVALLVFGAITASAAEREDTALTVYSSAQPGAIPPELYRPVAGVEPPGGSAVPGYAVVRHDRTVKLDAGRSTLRFTDVAALIDPTTVTFTSLTDPATRVLEQNFQFDLVSNDKLLQKYVDRTITVERVLGNQTSVLTGTLLSAASGNLVLRGNDGTVYSVRDAAAVRFPELPGGLITRPTLVWDLTASRAGEQRARVSYQTGGITWWADYNLIFDESKDGQNGTLDLSAWVSLINQSGATYPDARLKLIAGDVNRAPQPVPAPRMKEVMAMAARAEDAGGFEEKGFFEFHLYTLGRRTTLPDHSTKQIELFDQAKRIPARKTLVYDGAAMSWVPPQPMLDRGYGQQSNKKVDVFLEFRNDKTNGLGVPLPAGRIRVSKLDSADGSLEFIGEDRIDHTPKDERVKVKLGSAFDVVGERRQVDFAVDSKARWMEEEFEVKVRNHKDQPVDVVVLEHLYRWTNWRVVSQSQPFEKDDARTIRFPVKVAKDGEAVVRYRVRYTW